MTKQPTYVGGHKLLEGKTVLVTAAAGTGIGFATAVRCAEEGASPLGNELIEWKEFRLLLLYLKYPHLFPRN